MSDEQVKYTLSENEIPTHWVNLMADLPGDGPPPLHPGTLEPAGPDDLAALGFKIVIYANQGLRGALKAMEQLYAEILRSGSTASIESQLWPMKTIFALQGVTSVEKPVAAEVIVES